MLETVWAVVHDGKIETVGVVDAPEGTRALVTLLVEDENYFWQSASSASLDEIWDNEEDDVYAETTDNFVFQPASGFPRSGN
jgi:hypothetical protein